MPLDVENRNDVMVAVDNDDLIIDDEVEEPTPLRMDFDQHRRDLDDMHRGGHDGANPDREVDVVHAWGIAAAQHGFPHPGSLLRRQRYRAPTALASLGVGALALLGVIAPALLTLGPLSLAFGALASFPLRLGAFLGLSAAAAALAFGALLL